MNLMPRIAAAIGMLLLISSAPAQPAADSSGHWEGAIQLPDKELKITVDLAKDDKGAWMGAISIPAQKLSGVPLANIAVRGNSVNFLIKGIPGNPTFQGTLSSDAKTISGDFSQGGGTLTFKLTRTGDAKIEPPAKSTAITKGLEGTWEGTLDAPGKQLRLVLKMSNQPDGTAAGVLVSVDQDGVELQITTITQKDSNLRFEIKAVGGVYSGDLNKEGMLMGQWTQGGGSLPLTFKRPAKQESK